MLNRVRISRARQPQQQAASDACSDGTLVAREGKRGRILDRRSSEGRPRSHPLAIGFCADQNVMRRRRMEVFVSADCAS